MWSDCRFVIRSTVLVNRWSGGAVFPLGYVVTVSAVEGE